MTCYTNLQGAFSPGHFIDTIRIPTITIIDHFYPLQNKYISAKDTNLVHAYQYKDAGILLSDYTPLYLRNYGPGLIYSISLRGSNSAQASISWNGININSPMHGQIDLSLIKTNPTRSIGIISNSYENGLSGELRIDDNLDHKNNFHYNISERVSTLKGHENSGGISFNSNKISSVISYNIAHPNFLKT